MEERKIRWCGFFVFLALVGMFLGSCAGEDSRDGDDSRAAVFTRNHANAEAHEAEEQIDAELLDEEIVVSGSLEEQVSLLEELSQRQEQALQALHQRSDDLLKKLREVTSQGCLLDEPIDVLSISVDGQKLDDKRLEGRRRKDLYADARNTDLRIELGTVADQELSEVTELAGFFSSGSLVQFATQKFAEHTIGDIQYIRLVRPGYYIVRADDKSDTYGKGMLNNKVGAYERYIFTETHRYKLKGLEIKVKSRGNEYLLYRRQNLDQAFYYPAGSFQDFSLTANSAYQALLRQDCSI